MRAQNLQRRSPAENVLINEKVKRAVCLRREIQFAANSMKNWSASGEVGFEKAIARSMIVGPYVRVIYSFRRLCSGEKSIGPEQVIAMLRVRSCRK